MSRKEKKYHFIYKTIDTRNENFYIGMHSTDNLDDGYIGSGDRLKKLVYKHGKSIFRMEILEFLPDRESLKKREEEIINSELLKEDKCMNLCCGGGGFTRDEAICAVYKSNLVQKVLRETNPDWVTKKNNRCSISQKKSYDEGKREKRYFYDWNGKKMAEETKLKIGKSNSIQQKGNLNSQFGTYWITNGNENRKIKNEDLYLYEDKWWHGRSKINGVGGNQYTKQYLS